MTEDIKDLQNGALENDEDQIVVLTDNEGHDNYFRIDMVYPVEAKTYAVLVPVNGETGEDIPAKEADPDAEGDAFIVRVEFDAQGEENFIVPEDAEFEEACAAYEKFFQEGNEENSPK